MNDKEYLVKLFNEMGLCFILFSIVEIVSGILLNFPILYWCGMLLLLVLGIIILLVNFMGDRK